MKKALLILAMLVVAVCSTAIAQCVGKVINVGKKDNFVFVEVVYSVDGVKFGENDIALYSPTKFFGLKKAQAIQMISDEISNKCEQIIQLHYKLVNGIYPSVEAKSLAVDSILPKLNLIKNDVLNISVSKENIQQQYDTNGDGVENETWTINSDGTKSVSNIVP